MSINRLIKRGTKVTHKKAVIKSSDETVTTVNDNAVVTIVKEPKAEPKTKKNPAKNNARKNKKNMMTEEQIASAENMANVLSDTKVIKRDKGLIERTESSKIILTEDNRQLLND